MKRIITKKNANQRVVGAGTDMLKMTEYQAESLYRFLKSHEKDIANDINDFGDLKITFSIIFGRPPEK
jgi:hypothetical protein